MPRFPDPVPGRAPVAPGFSLLELVIVIILVVLLFLVVFNRLMPLRGDAEAANVATVIGSLRSAIGMEAASRVIRDGLPSLAELEGINPMMLLQEWPDRYIGESEQTGAADIASGTWYFQTSTRTLAYRVRFPEYLEGAPVGPVDLRWRVVLQFEDISGSGEFDPAVDRPRGLRLEPIDAYQWPDQPRGRIRPP